MKEILLMFAILLASVTSTQAEERSATCKERGLYCLVAFGLSNKSSPELKAFKTYYAVSEMQAGNSRKALYKNGLATAIKQAIDGSSNDIPFWIIVVNKTGNDQKVTFYLMKSDEQINALIIGSDINCPFNAPDFCSGGKEPNLNSAFDSHNQNLNEFYGNFLRAGKIVNQIDIDVPAYSSVARGVGASTNEYTGKYPMAILDERAADRVKFESSDVLSVGLVMQ